MDNVQAIICLSLSRHDSPISSPAFSLAKELAKSLPVYYIDHPYSYKDILKERNTLPVKRRISDWVSNRYLAEVQDLPQQLRIVNAPLTIPVNFLQKSRLYNFLSAINDNKIYALIRKIKKDHGIERFIFINFFDPFFCKKFPLDIKPLMYVYQSMDDISEVEYTRRHGTRLEQQIISHADITLCTSRELTRIHKQYAHNVFYHPNAVDIDLFEKAIGEDLPVPDELKGIDKDIIGFTGSIDYRSDLILLEKIAASFPDKILCFVGPLNDDKKIHDRLIHYDNVLFTGAKSIRQLPAFLRRFNCVIIPYLKNKLTSSIYPLKINEYLAAGKPVIATDFSEDIIAFSPVIYISRDHDEFLGHISTALKEDKNVLQTERIEIARKNSWKTRVNEFWEIIRKKTMQRSN